MWTETEALHPRFMRAYYAHRWRLDDGIIVHISRAPKRCVLVLAAGAMWTSFYMSSLSFSRSFSWSHVERRYVVWVPRAHSCGRQPTSQHMLAAFVGVQIYARRATCHRILTVCFSFSFFCFLCLSLVCDLRFRCTASLHCIRASSTNPNWKSPQFFRRWYWVGGIYWRSTWAKCRFIFFQLDTSAGTVYWASSCPMDDDNTTTSRTICAILCARGIPAANEIH